jgi:hypothetical protein
MILLYINELIIIFNTTVPFILKLIILIATPTNIIINVSYWLLSTIIIYILIWIFETFYRILVCWVQIHITLGCSNWYIYFEMTLRIWYWSPSSYTIYWFYSTIIIHFTFFTYSYKIVFIYIWILLSIFIIKYFLIFY